MNALLYGVVTLIWGSTWLAIKYQLGVVAPEASVAYRFALAALFLFGWSIARGMPLRYKLKDHFFMALLGALMFSTNYVLFYIAESHLTSGLVAIIFSIALFMNIGNKMLFFRQTVKPSVLLGATFGLAGITFVFWRELVSFSLDSSSGRGIALSLAGTLLFSFGNMVSARNQRVGLPIIQSTAYGMAYGAALLTIFALLFGIDLKLDMSFAYLSSLIYLALFGSVIGFGCYLTLLGRIGAERAAYATVLTPVIALGLSTLFERFTWTLQAVVGVCLILIGNVVVLRKPKAA